jgi:hypothetical protein
MTDRTRRRIFTVLLAPSLALAAWGLVHLIGVDLAVSTGSGEVGPRDVLARPRSSVRWWRGSRRACSSGGAAGHGRRGRSPPPQRWPPR